MHDWNLGGVLLNREQVESASNAGVFAGFDEVWFLATGTIQRQIPPKYTIPDTVDRLLNTLSAFESWLKETQCILALGDGVEHLSYATWDGTIAALIESQETK
ncbi:MAG TPA: hypothetical protein VFE46_09365 [Pirellulales bacterium]|jgi:hypothetical protein|nr:hypothetical protein [Pirellulales bacterium]